MRYGVQTLGAEPGFFARLAPALVRAYGDSFPELRAREAHIVQVLQDEEGSFSTLLQHGVQYFAGVERELRAAGEDCVSGERAFYMYDTLGFPLDLTEIMAQEKDLRVDVAGFHLCMDAQVVRSKRATALKKLQGREELVLGIEHFSQLKVRVSLRVSLSMSLCTPLCVSVSALHSR